MNVVAEDVTEEFRDLDFEPFYPRGIRGIRFDVRGAAFGIGGPAELGR